MDRRMMGRLMALAARHNARSDVSHDITHLKKVMANAIIIAEKEGGDQDVVVPAALFHDLITYRKDDRRSRNAPGESAALASRLLAGIGYPRDKISKIAYAIKVHSFTEHIEPKTLDAKILQDADMLEATGAVAIMRTFASSGAMQRPFYDDTDPFCRHRESTPHRYAMDLFYSRLLVVKDRMHTETARRMAGRRTRFLLDFIRQAGREIHETDAILNPRSRKPRHRHASGR